MAKSPQLCAVVATRSTYYENPPWDYFLFARKEASCDAPAQLDRPSAICQFQLTE